MGANLSSEFTIPEWNQLNRDVKIYIIAQLPYIDLNRYRRVCKQWKENIDSILQSYPSSQIYDGLFNIKFRHPHYDSINVHIWSYTFSHTELMISETKRIFPKKIRKRFKPKTPASIEEAFSQFATDIRNQFTRKFIQERIKMFNLLFDEELDHNSAIFSSDILFNLIVADLPGEFYSRMNCKNQHEQACTYSMGCFPKKKAIYLYDQDPHQADLIWQGIDRDLNIAAFKRYGECDWQNTNPYLGFLNGQHIIEFVIYKTQRVFNVLNINWRTFSCTKNNIENLRHQYKEFCLKNPQELEEM